MNLSEAQARALGKLTEEWQSAFDLKAGIDILERLCRKGLADHKQLPGSELIRKRYLYRLKTGGENESKTS